ncbi:DUF4959 domain-containing protein [Pedobacter frigoris]|uniref:DUF4959 domain-containing protein n=1 Tax=Pedobacter frigoris TaxID=2571272 RepID=UPI002930B8A8|nr:DUF4959 domain-containing protein [Pedobacter frigoris]
MKKNILFLLLSLVSLTFASCTKVDELGVVSNDMTKPGPITNVQVKNINGAAIITYQLPKSSNILYVLSDYTINDKTGAKRQTKSSYYTDTTFVEGFAEAKEYEVKMEVYSRAGVASDPVIVKVRPEKPVYKLVREQLLLNADFAGINVRATNDLKKKIGVILLYDDPAYGKYVIRQQSFNNLQQINFSSRGLDTLPKRVAAYVTDEFGNRSDTLYSTIKPLYETALDRTKFFAYTLPSDKAVYPGPYSVNSIFNNVLGEDMWHTDVLTGAAAAYPYNCTFGLGIKAKLSRFTLHERSRSDWSWGQGNAKLFSVWGSDKELPADVVFPVGVPEGTVVGDWVNLGNYKYPDPPSGNIPSPGTVTAADRQFMEAGVDFNFPISAVPVKYIRMSVEETWGKVAYAALVEIKLFGDPRIR